MAMIMQIFGNECEKETIDRIRLVCMKMEYEGEEWWQVNTNIIPCTSIHIKNFSDIPKEMSEVYRMFIEKGFKSGSHYIFNSKDKERIDPDNIE